MSSTTTKGRHAAGWSFERGISDNTARVGPRNGKHRATMIDTFKLHVLRRFGK